MKKNNKKIKNETEDVKFFIKKKELQNKILNKSLKTLKKKYK